jgi:hypothetical protein
MFPERLTEGYRTFAAGRFVHERSRYETLAEKGQHPEIMVVGCVDSRVSPEVIFDAAPGEILVVRNVAAIIPPYQPDHATQHGTSAAGSSSSPRRARRSPRAISSASGSARSRPPPSGSARTPMTTSSTSRANWNSPRSS